MSTINTPDTTGVGNTVPVSFYFMKEGHYYRNLGFSKEENARCYIPEDDSSRSAILGLSEKGVAGLTQQVHLVVLRLAFETFSSRFSVEISPTSGTKFQDLVDVGSIDLAGMSVEQAQSGIRNLVNQKLVTSN